METIGARVRFLRKTLGMTQKEFGGKIGMTRAGIATYEREKIKPRPHVIQAFCQTFNVNEEWLVNGTGEIFFEVLEEDAYFKAVSELAKEKDLFAMKIVIEYWKLNAEKKKLFKEFIGKISQIYYSETIEKQDENNK